MSEGLPDPLLDACRDVVAALDATADEGEQIAAVAVVWLIHRKADDSNDCGTILSHTMTRDQLLHIADAFADLADQTLPTAPH